MLKSFAPKIYHDILLSIQTTTVLPNRCRLQFNRLQLSMQITRLELSISRLQLPITRLWDVIVDYDIWFLTRFVVTRQCDAGRLLIWYFTIDLSTTREWLVDLLSSRRILGDSWYGTCRDDTTLVENFRLQDYDCHYKITTVDANYNTADNMLLLFIQIKWLPTLFEIE